jgi:protein-S-isoprenylcysteine O-methyltransferase Ste14
LSAGSSGDDGHTGSPQDVANLGLLRPPLIYLGSIVLGLLLHWVLPVGLAPRVLGRLVGGATTLGAVALLIASVRTFRAAGTPVPGNRPTTTIVRNGPYRFSRNPIYLAFSLLQMGIALWVSSLWVVVTLAGAVALMSLVVIPREERYLEARFPSEYLPYRESVRRWI